MVGGDEGGMGLAAKREVGEFTENEGRVGAGREAGLYRLEVEEFSRIGRGFREEKGGGKAGRDKCFTEGSVGGPDKECGVRKREVGR